MMIKKILASGSNLKLWHEYFPWPGGVEKFSRVAKFFGRNVHPLMANIVLKSHCSRGRLSMLTVVKYQGVALRIEEIDDGLFFYDYPGHIITHFFQS